MSDLVEPVFLTHRPPPALRPYVTVAHGYRVSANPTGLHRGLPSRRLTLVVELAGPLGLSGLGAPVRAHGVVGGLHTCPALIDASQPQDGVQLALTPTGARALLGVPAGALGGLALDLVDVLGVGADRLVERMATARGWTARFAVLDEVLLARLREVPAAAPEVRHAWQLLAGSDGRARVTDVARAVGWSRRHLSERFRAETGLTPKELARVARFEASRLGLLAGWSSPGGSSLADLAAGCGFADQAHLAREWRALAGCSISTWLAEELPFVQDGAAADAPG